MSINRNNNSLSFRILIMYMISALLFLMSTHLHIHSQEAALTADHGAAVSVSSLIEDVIQAEAGDQINIDPDGMLKNMQAGFSFALVFLLVVLLTFNLARSCIRCGFSRRSHLLLLIPDYESPLLRAPPQ